MSRRIFCKLLFVAVAVFGLLVLPGLVSAQGRSEEALERVIKVQEKYTGALMARAGVEGTGVGYDENGELAIKIYTATAGLPDLPEQLERVPVQVVVTGEFHARVDPTAWFPRPVPIGVSTGHPDITAGTIGCRVKDASGNVYALSNNHVYANSNDASIGDSALQPGPYDGGKDPEDAIGTLHDFEPINFSGGDNTIDAAIALTDAGLLGVATPGIEGVDGYGTPSSSTVAAFPEMPVQKYGRTTRWTHGQVSAINATVDVCYETRGPFRCVKLARFVDQIVITPGDFSAGGDSGSLIVTDYPDNPENDKRPVGLLFAGSDTHTIANPIDAVLGAFGVTIDGGQTSTGSISGTVTSSDGGGAIEGAIVSTDTGQSATTASDGTYFINEVPTGDRLVTASADGFQPETQSAIVNENETSTVDFVLNPIPVGSITGFVTSAGDSTPISGATVTVDTGQSDTTGADGSYTIGDVPTGDRSVTASADGFQPETKSATVNENETTTVDFALNPVTTPTNVIVILPSGSDGYATQGGRYRDKHLLVTVALEDDLGNPVAGASVSIDLDLDGSPDSSGTGTTGTDGTVTFTRNNAPSGTYTTKVTDVTAAGLTWDGETPPNSFTK